MSVIVRFFEHSLAFIFFGIGMKTDLFQSCGHCWAFQICWHKEWSTFTAFPFRIWNSSTGIPSPWLALFVVMLPNAHLSSRSRMSGCRWVIIPSWLSGLWTFFCTVLLCIQFSLVQSLSHVWLFATPWTAARQASLSITTPGVHPNPCPFCQWCHPTISSSVIPFSSCPPSFPASGSFQMSQFSTSGGQSTGVSASTSVPLVNTQDWSPVGWTAWICLQSKELSRVFSSIAVQKHQFFGTQLSSQSNSHIHTWLLEKP